MSSVPEPPKLPLEGSAHLVSGLLRQRAMLMASVSDLREQLAQAANAVEAIDQVLETVGHTEPLEGRTPRAARIVLFYRNELRAFLVERLRESPEPLTSRALAYLICEGEGKSHADRRLLSDVTRRVGCALRKMRAMKVVEGWRAPDGAAYWRLAKKDKPLPQPSGPVRPARSPDWPHQLQSIRRD